MKNKADKKDTDPTVQTPPDTETEKQERNPAENASCTDQKAEEIKKEEPVAEEKKQDAAAEKIASLEKTVAELEDKRIRLLAEMENQRKRALKDMESVRNNVMTDTLHPFFQVFDHFSMAVAATGATNNLQALLEGMKMIQAEFDKAFSELGIEKIDATGKDFDPTRHEAVSEEASETVPAGKVLRQWCFGYKCGERLLKPAGVVVSAGPAGKTAEKQ